MRSKRIQFSRILPAMLLGGIFILCGCNNEKDLYNPEHIQEKAKEAFPVKDIDPNQTWETSAVCNASVSVNEKAGEVYTIKIYTDNPYNTNGEAALLATTTVENGKTVNFKFDIPTALQYVYVMKVNKAGYSSAKFCLVENSKIAVSFGGGNSMTRAAGTRAISSVVNFTVPDDKYFPTVESTSGYPLYRTDNSWTNVEGNYIVTPNYKDIDYQGNGGGVYIKGDVTLTSLYLGSNCKLFVLPGSTLTLNSNGYSLGQSGSMISIGTNAKLVVKNGTLQASNTNIYNSGTIEANAIEVTAGVLSNAYIYNSGTLAITEKVNVATENSLLVNEGTITAASFETQGSSSFYNSGEVTISGKSFLSSGNQAWENQGTFRTNAMEIESKSNRLLNACKLYITEEFKISVSQADIDNNTFNVDGGAYIECGSLYLNNATINMGGKSYFNVKGTATYDWNPTGFYATTQDYALLKIGSTVQRNPENGNAIGYHGNLYVACDNHFSNGYSGSVPYINWSGNAQMTGADNASISIPASACNPGYNGIPDGGGSSDDKIQAYSYAYEDMMQEVGDYDFNDVVLYVTVPYDRNGKKAIDVTLKAAGASKQLIVHFDDGQNSQVIFEDVHAALGVSSGTIVNTGSATGTAKTKTISVTNDFNLTENGDFYISDGKREIHIPKFTPEFKNGNVPYALRITNTAWKWPKERIYITEAYPDFEGWAHNATSDITWHNNPIDSKVMN